MRRLPFLGSFLAMAMAMASAPTIAFSGDLVAPLRERPSGAPGFRRRKKTPFPHSSTRQRARYARQIAAGQLCMEGC